MPKRKNNISRPWVDDRVSFSRNRDFSSFYNARVWRKTTKIFLKENPFCVDCERVGIVKAAKVTDHILGLGFMIDNDLNPYDLKKLQPLCHNHHNKKSGRESHLNRGMGLKKTKK
jgi:5-methylcytosine-specific restriction endonuclease McrA